jgi:hypothetical protein
MNVAAQSAYRIFMEPPAVSSAGIHPPPQGKRTFNTGSQQAFIRH